MDSPRDRSVMLQMAQVWSRLAEYAAKTAARKECTELISPAAHPWLMPPFPPGDFAIQILLPADLNAQLILGAQADPDYSTKAL
jgi:hypothetical protein